MGESVKLFPGQLRKWWVAISGHKRGIFRMLIVNVHFGINVNGDSHSTASLLIIFSPISSEL